MSDDSEISEESSLFTSVDKYIEKMISDATKKRDEIAAIDTSRFDLILYKTEKVKQPKKYKLPFFTFHSGQMIMYILSHIYTSNLKRTLLYWQTGSGKTFALATIANRFIEQYIARDVIPRVFVIGFTKNIILEQFISNKALKFVTAAEIAELARLKSSDRAAMQKSYSAFLGTLKRRITEPSRGGHYQFYGYKEFANKLFIPVEETFNEEIFYRDIDFQKITREIKNGKIRVNETLLDSLKNNILFADEIHNVYNIHEKNTYGAAIEYVLNVLGDNAPRAFFMSATPISGSATEVVDLINLLVPGVNFSKSEFFVKGKVPSELKPDALTKIAKLVEGRVSSYADTDLSKFPQRIFVGESIKNIPYLKFTVCKETTAQKKAIKDLDGVIPLDSYTLYDMIFPENVYKQEDIAGAAAASKKFSVTDGIITGEFLKRSNIEKYSLKYANMLDMMESMEGKILIYHNRVQMSGVMLIEELLRQNGYIGFEELPSDYTRCAVCGKIRSAHKLPHKSAHKLPHKTTEEHEYYPAKFITAHYAVDKQAFNRGMLIFNSSANAEGYQIKIIIGSRVIREGYNFKAIRHEIITSLPDDIPTLIQIFGRVVRNASHVDLPPPKRNARIYILATPSELVRYREKMQEFKVIQEIERVIKSHAFDADLNYGKMIRSVSLYRTDKLEATLETLPFKPASHFVGDNKRLYYNWFSKQYFVERMVVDIKNLFKIRQIWTYDDLLEFIRSNKLEGMEYNGKYVEEDTIAMALYNLTKQGVDFSMVRYGKYYMINRPSIVEGYLRDMARSSSLVIDIRKYYEEVVRERTFLVQVNKFIQHVIKITSGEEIITALMAYDEIFIYDLLKKIVQFESNKKSLSVEARDHISKIPSLFIVIMKKWKVLIKNGFRWNESYEIFNPVLKTWSYVAATAYFEIKKDNPIGVGYIEDGKFKLRPPIGSQKHTDGRKIERGAVCETRKREFLVDLGVSLRIITKETSIMTSELCRRIMKELIRREFITRSGRDSQRWFLLFNEQV